MLFMAEGTPIWSHLDDFNYVIIDFKSLDVKFEGYEKATLLVVSLHASYKYFKKILLYNNNDTLSFEGIKANLLSNEKFDLKVRAEKGQGL